MSAAPSGEIGPTLVDSGLAYCTAHNGVIECDGGDGPCDFQGNGDPDFKCLTCDGAGVVDEEEADGLVTCTVCDGEGLTPCVPTPLLYDNGGSDVQADA